MLITWWQDFIHNARVGEAQGDTPLRKKVRSKKTVAHSAIIESREGTGWGRILK